MSIFKRKNSKYYWMKFTFDGELIQKSTKTTNKKKANDIESAFRTQLFLGKIGIHLKKAAPSLKEACEDFLTNVKINHSNKPQTVIRYSNNVDIILKYFGNPKVDRIEPSHVEAFKMNLATRISSRTKRNLKPNTINHTLLTLRMIFNRLVDFDFLTKNPARKVKRLAVPKTAAKIITIEEQRRYLLACHPRLKEVAVMMIELGMRPAEILNLKKEDVSLDNNLLEVKEGKTKNASRTLPLTEAAQKVLEYRFAQSDSDRLFSGLTIWALNEWHLKAVKQIGIEKFSKDYFTLYKLRHCFATRHAENKTDIITLSELLGHGDLKTLRTYAQPSLEHKIEAVKRVESETRRRSKIG